MKHYSNISRPVILQSCKPSFHWRKLTSSVLEAMQPGDLRMNMALSEKDWGMLDKYIQSEFNRRSLTRANFHNVKLWIKTMAPAVSILTNV